MPDRSILSGLTIGSRVRITERSDWGHEYTFTGTVEAVSIVPGEESVRIVDGRMSLTTSPEYIVKIEEGEQ